MCLRCKSCKVLSSKVCIPKLIRLNGKRRNVCTYSSVKSSGLASNVISTVFKVTYQNQTEGEVIVKNTDYSRFYLKNLAPVYRKNKIDIPFMGVFPFIFKSGKRTSESWAEYIKIKKWVRDNGSKFKQDAKSVIQDWESE